MKKTKNRPLQALIAISALAIVAFTLMAVIIPLVNDRLLQDKDRFAEEPASVVELVAPTETTIAATISEVKGDTTETVSTTSLPQETKANQGQKVTETLSSEEIAPSPSTSETILEPVVTGSDLVSENSDPTQSSEISENDDTELTEIPPYYLTDYRVRDIYEKYAPMVASIQVYLPGTSDTNDKMAIFSGLIISDEGKVITFASNFSFALAYGDILYERTEVRIVVSDRPKSFSAHLLGVHKDTDLAIFQIENASNLPVAQLKSEANLSVGEPIIAIGQQDVLMSQGGLSLGLITGVYHPSVLENNLSVSMIQTSAFISSQASGGPLLNLSGEIIGLNNSNLNRSYADIMGYAIPSSMLLEALERMENPPTDEVRPWLGIVTLTDAKNGDLLELMNWPSGLYISQVVEGSPAYTAGIRNGDILIDINGVVMRTHNEFTEYIAEQPIGTLVRVRVYRTIEKRFLNLQIYLGRMP